MKTKKAPWAFIALGLSLLVGTVMAQIVMIERGDERKETIGNKTDTKPTSSEGAKVVQQTSPYKVVAATDTAKPSSRVANIRLDDHESIVIIGFDGSYKSNYVTPNGVAYGDAIYRIDLTASFKNGIAVGLAKIGSFGNGSSPYSEEYQALIEKTWRPCSDEWYITVGFRYEFIDGPWDLAVPYGEIGRNWGIGEDSELTAYGRAEYWWNPQGTTDDNGTITTIGLRFLTRLNDKLSLRLGASGVYDPGVQGGAVAVIGVGEAYLDYAVTSETTAYAGGKYYSPHADGPSRLKTQKVFELGVKVNDFPKQIGKAVNFLRGEVGE